MASDVNKLAAKYNVDPDAIVDRLLALMEQGLPREKALLDIDTELGRIAGQTKLKPSKREDDFDQAAIDKDINDLFSGEVSGESVITSVVIRTAKEVFKDKAKHPESLVICIECEDGAELNTTLPRGLKYADGKWIIENDAAVRRSVRQKFSYLGQFLKKYKHWPNVGVEVETDVDEDGYARIVL